jgi:hypothetical protein
MNGCSWGNWSTNRDLLQDDRLVLQLHCKACGACWVASTHVHRKRLAVERRLALPVLRAREVSFNHFLPPRADIAGPIATEPVPAVGLWHLHGGHWERRVCVGRIVVGRRRGVGVYGCWLVAATAQSAAG